MLRGPAKIDSIPTSAIHTLHNSYQLNLFPSLIEENWIIYTILVIYFPSFPVKANLSAIHDF